MSQYKDGKKEGLSTRWYGSGQKELEFTTHKDGKKEGLSTRWYRSGQKWEEKTYKDGNLITAVVWKPNGEKCPVTNIVDGNGVVVVYNDDGTEAFRQTFKDGELVSD